MWRKSFVLFVVFLFCSAIIFAQQSKSLPYPPPGTDRGKITRLPLLDSPGTEVVISGIPSYIWQHGCGPTALGMVIGYYDGLGFTDLVSGSAATQTVGVNDAIANNSHYSDYSQPIDNPPTMLSDKSTLGGAHTSNCLADFMKTSWSAESNYYGWSWSNQITNSFNLYVPFINSVYQHQSGNYSFSNPLAWSTFMTEIDNNRPVVLLVDSDGNGGTDHFVTGIGYDNTAKTYAIYDTWDHNIHWFQWRAMSSSYTWGIWGYTTFNLKFLIAASASPSGNGTVLGTGYFYSGSTVTLTANAANGYDFLNWTENGTVVSSLASYQFSASSNRILVANFVETPPVIQNKLAVENITVTNVQTVCFNAYDTITVAGNVTAVLFESGSSVNLIAGLMISFLPGFHASEGSFMNAYITTDGTFCGGATGGSVVAEPNEKSTTDRSLQPGQSVVNGEKLMTVYPNPNNGCFKIELTNFDGNALVSVYNSLGERVYQSVYGNDNYEINLPNITKGIYFVRVNSGKDQFTKKIIVK